jgi:hypothetical protein
MKNKVIVMSFGAVIWVTGCAADDESLSQSTENLVVAPGAFVSPVENAQGSALACGPQQVMLGIHLAQGRVICASLNFGYKVLARYNDPAAPQGTQVGANPAMHGCRRPFFIQAVNLTGPGQDETLDCVSLETADNIALDYSSIYQDGDSPPTASKDVYNINNPNMHVCKATFAMVGIHRSQNNLFCAN